MDYGKSYAKALTNITENIKKINIEAKKLRNDKIATQKLLYEWMERMNIDEYEGYKRQKIKPKEKPKIIRKKKKDKVEDALRLFRDIGIPDPEEFYAEYQATQKNIIADEESY